MLWRCRDCGIQVVADREPRRCECGCRSWVKVGLEAGVGYGSRYGYSNLAMAMFEKVSTKSYG